jgi:ABC-2 type transport system ATP-binding protein
LIPAKEMRMIQISGLRHAYGAREALAGVSLEVKAGEIFGLLGPNGSGKTTLFRILATSLAPLSGRVTIGGLEPDAPGHELRRQIGVVFQSPSLDDKLTVAENLKCHGWLYGLRGRELARRMDTMLARLGLSDRARERVAKLSGGLKRRVELAKGLLHAPKVLILDEPSTGLDPGARIDLWKYLKTLRDADGVTVLVTTHLMDEADHCDRIAILNAGQIVAAGPPAELKARVGGDVLVVRPQADQGAEALERAIRARFQVRALVADGVVQIEHPDGTRFVTALVEAFPGMIGSVTYRKPTLEDAFVHFTGHRFWGEPVGEAAYV